MSTWLPGFTRDESIRGAGGGSYTGDYPWRFLLHTTEGSWDSAMSVFRSKTCAPHLMYDPATRRKVQFIDLDRSAYALRHDGPETNRARCIQVEIVGFADRPYTGEMADRIGIDVVAPVLAAKPITTAHPTFYGPDCGWTLASASARQRMSAAAWGSFNGICGHQHAPGNSHWDPGAIDIARIIAASNQGEDDMTTEELRAELAAQGFKQAILALQIEQREIKRDRRRWQRLWRELDKDDQPDPESDARLAEIETELQTLQAKLPV